VIRCSGTHGHHGAVAAGPQEEQANRNSALLVIDGNLWYNIYNE